MPRWTAVLSLDRSDLLSCSNRLPVLTKKDGAHPEFELPQGVDWVALSFVPRANDLDEITCIINGRAGLVSKIEKAGYTPGRGHLPCARLRCHRTFQGR